MSVWELSDDSCSAFVRTQIVGKTKFFDSLEKYVCPKERNMIYWLCIEIRQHRTMKAAALCGNFAP